MTKEQIREAVARAICDTWGYCWDGDPDSDDEVPPDDAESAYDDRPTKEMFLKAAQNAIDAHLAALGEGTFEITKTDAYAAALDKHIRDNQERREFSAHYIRQMVRR